MNSAPSSRSAIDRILDSVAECLDGPSAEALLRLRASKELQERLDELADRCTEGQLTAEERDEYETLIKLSDFISLLQANARRRLSVGRAA